MNVSECCKAIGCNCAGTIQAELWNKIGIIPMFIGLVVCVLIISYLIYRVTEKWDTFNQR